MQKKWLARLYKNRQLVILVLLCLVFAVLLPRKFLTIGNFRNILYAISLQGIMICGATFPVLLAGIDRTVSGSAALAGAVCCTTIVSHGFSTGGTLLGVLLGIGVGLLSGVFHGLVLSRFNIPAFLLTLATSEILYGLVQTVTGNQLINVMNAKLFNLVGSSRILGVLFVHLRHAQPHRLRQAPLLRRRKPRGGEALGHQRPQDHHRRLHRLRRHGRAVRPRALEHEPAGIREPGEGV
jgi:ribose/xylose/arabinose/galactoside ABC-type transport system permease subunit